MMAETAVLPNGERTGAQVLAICGPELTRPAMASYETYRAMRIDPTLALARLLAVGPVLASAWSVEADDDASDEAVQFVSDVFLPLRPLILESALYGGLDFGWQPYEVVRANGKADGSGRTVLKKVKPLLQDLTRILVDEKTGAFRGFRQYRPDGVQVDLSADAGECLLIAFDVEGTNWYGRPLLENARATYNQWNEANAVAARYDRKVAGSHFVVRFPIGRTPLNGVDTDNADIASTLLRTLEGSGSISIPVTVAAFVDELNAKDYGWNVEILSDSQGKQPSFVDRLKYLDALKCRALGMPERTAIEGEFGTKAEAGVHQSIALTAMELRHQHVVRMLNWHTLNKLLVENFGPEAENKVYLVPAPISDESLAYLREVYKAILANPTGFLEEYDNIDTDSLKDKLGVPKAAEVAQIGEPGSDETAAGDGKQRPEEPLPGMDPTDAERMRIADRGGRDEPPPATGKEAGAAAGKSDVQQQALNGAQIASVVSVCEQVISGAISRGAAIELLAIAFPLLPRTQIVALVEKLEVKEKKPAAGQGDGQQPPPQPPPPPPRPGQQPPPPPQPQAKED